MAAIALSNVIKGIALRFKTKSDEAELQNLFEQSAAQRGSIKFFRFLTGGTIALLLLTSSLTMHFQAESSNESIECYSVEI